MDEISRKAEEMLDELLSNQLEVVLIPAPEPLHTEHQIRAVQYANADWYREFCAQFHTSRTRPKRSLKFDTKIKRSHTIRALEKIVSGERSGVYVERLVEFIESKIRQETRKRLAPSEDFSWLTTSRTRILFR